MILDTRIALVFNIVSYLGTWDCITGEGVITYLYGGIPVGIILRPRIQEYHNYFIERQSIELPMGRYMLQEGPPIT